MYALMTNKSEYEGGVESWDSTKIGPQLSRITSERTRLKRSRTFYFNKILLY